MVSDLLLCKSELRLSYILRKVFTTIDFLSNMRNSHNSFLCQLQDLRDWIQRTIPG